MKKLFILAIVLFSAAVFAEQGGGYRILSNLEMG